MPHFRLSLSFVAPLLTLLLAGCATSGSKVEMPTPDNEFITYTPRPEGSSAPRLAVKDLIDVKGMMTTAGSQYVGENSAPAVRDAACMAGARAAGAHIVGKTSLTEFAVSMTGINGYHGTPKNPLDIFIRVVPGGSSSGSAVAVGNGMADIAYGTDTAGSIRVPAACCGVIGLKTTFGLVPLEGVFPLSPKNLDTVGPMAADIPNLVRGMDMLKPGFRAKYEQARAAHPTAKSLRVGRLYVPGTSAAMDRAVDRALAAQGFTVVIMGKDLEEAWEAAEKNAELVAHVDAWLSNKGYLDKPGLTSQTRAIISTGELNYPTNYRAALAERVIWRQALRKAFREVDLIAMPVLKSEPPRLPILGGILLESAMLSIQNTAAVNYAGNPAIAVPIPEDGDDGEIEPGYSVQFIGPNHSEATLVNAGRLLIGGSGEGSTRDLAVWRD